LFDLDKAGYQYSFVTGPDRNYLWLLARTPHVQEEVLEKFIREANRLGFNTEKLIFVKHHPEPCNAAG
jgi:apolipoprotein D and lipocalin family protein